MSNQNALFRIRLSYKKDAAWVWARPGRTGDYLGSGDGAISGDQISGQVRWDLFEKVEETVCEANLRGLIDTDDGATIQFETLGFFRRPTQPDNPIWVNVSAVTFHTEHDRYLWLNEVTAAWQGTFDMSTYQHNYDVYPYGIA